MYKYRTQRTLTKQFLNILNDKGGGRAESMSHGDTVAPIQALQTKHVDGNRQRKQNQSDDGSGRLESMERVTFGAMLLWVGEAWV